jgi:hypothetical protein
MKVQTERTQTNACFVACTCACGKHSLYQHDEKNNRIPFITISISTKTRNSSAFTPRCADVLLMATWRTCHLRAQLHWRTYLTEFTGFQGLLVVVRSRNSGAQHIQTFLDKAYKLILIKWLTLFTKRTTKNL